MTLAPLTPLESQLLGTSSLLHVNIDTSPSDGLLSIS